jgi:predicted acetyltransferase
LEFRALGESDLEAMLRVRVRAFGPMSADGAQRWEAVNRELVADGRLFGVFDGTTLAGCGKARGFEQVWNGRRVPMAGMAGITVLPEFRGRGVGTLLMRGLARESVARGEPISALYPATVPVYRKLGWELVGAQSRYALSAQQLRVLGGGARVEPLTAADAARARQLTLDAVAADRASGPIVWSEQRWRRTLEDPNVFAYHCADGLLVYGWDGSDLSVDILWGATEDAIRSLWSVVGSGSSVAPTVRAYLAPDDPVFWLLPEEAHHEVGRHGWMLRVLDMESALAMRGYPAGLTAELPLSVEDPEDDANANAGGFVLRVEAGQGTVSRADDREAGLRVTARGLAALYAGRPASALRRAGLLCGGTPADEELADRVFATTTPYLTEYF